MFRLEEIISSNQFIRQFPEITRKLIQIPGAILITRKTGKHFAFMNAEIFQDLIDCYSRYSVQGSILGNNFFEK